MAAEWPPIEKSDREREQVVQSVWKPDALILPSDVTSLRVNVSS